MPRKYRPPRRREPPPFPTALQQQTCCVFAALALLLYSTVRHHGALASPPAAADEARAAPNASGRPPALPPLGARRSGMVVVGHTHSTALLVDAYGRVVRPTAQGGETVCAAPSVTSS